MPSCRRPPGTAKGPPGNQRGQKHSIAPLFGSWGGGGSLPPCPPPPRWRRPCPRHQTLFRVRYCNNEPPHRVHCTRPDSCSRVAHPQISHSHSMTGARIDRIGRGRRSSYNTAGLRRSGGRDRDGRQPPHPSGGAPPLGRGSSAEDKGDVV